ncbi:hypothetical protein L7F22_057083 [Adiantum nelumboides]|nr:hypothetical protein [Adiantum nelumboides]
MAPSSKKLRLLSVVDRKVVKVEAAVAAQSSQLVRYMLQDLGSHALLPLALPSPVLLKFFQFPSSSSSSSSSTSGSTNVVNPTSELEDFFTSLPPSLSIFHIFKAADYLLMDTLMDACASRIAKTMEGKSTEQMRAEFDLPRDLTIEQVRQVKRKNSWLISPIFCEDTIF